MDMMSSFLDDYFGKKEPVDALAYLDSPGERESLTDLTIGEDGNPAAHELAAVVRMANAGYTGNQIQQTLGIGSREAQHEMRLGREAAYLAETTGRPVHNGKVPKGAK